MKSLSRTAEQIAAADPAQSVWVAANAGTGKTRVLIDRISRLLLGGVPAGRILCLTFTKAAAAEMAERLSRRLGAWAVMEEDKLWAELAALEGGEAGSDLARARRLFAQYLETPGGLKIQTIHAFCESLLARFPLETGIAPHFSVADERTAAELLGEAKDAVLAKAFAGGRRDLVAAIEYLAGQVDETGFKNVIRELTAKRGILRRLIERHGGLKALFGAARRALGVDGDDDTASVIAAACAEGAFDREGLARACESLETGSAKTDGERAATLAAWLAGDAPERERGFRDPYARAFINQTGEPKAEERLMTKKLREADPESWRILIAEQARVLRVAERLKAVAVAESTEALLRLGEAMVDGYAKAKAARGLLDYDDLISKALALLDSAGGASWALFKLDRGLEHILVDEAQDTSPEQWAVIRALAGEFFAGEGAGEAGRTLFVVGDEKQSIYSFQGADPEGFGRMRSYFAERTAVARERLAIVNLAKSFRATWTLLETVDRVFSPEGARDGLTSAEDAIRHLSSRDGQAGLVELWPPLKPGEVPGADPWDAPLDRLSAESPEARLAARIADRIKGWIETGEILQSRNRRIEAGDVMILVRTRNRFFEKMVRELKVKGIPVAGADRMVLTEQLAVMDLIALAAFALLPEDDLNTAVVLKGPLIGLDDDALFALAHGRGGSLWDELRKRRPDSPLFAAAHDLLSGLLAKADFAPPYEFFAGLLGPGGGRKKLLARLGREAGDPIDEFLALSLAYERQHVPSLQGFLQWVEAGQAQVKRDLEHGLGEVRVMTVHGAKGLQAPIVFLPDTCTLPDPRLDDKLQWNLDGDDPAVLWPVRRQKEEEVCRVLREAARRRIEREYRRLLYVAMTRAEDRLYVAGYENKRGRAEGCWYDLIEAAMAGRAEEVVLEDGEAALRISSPQTAPREPAKAAEPPQEAGELPPWATSSPPGEADPPKPLAPSKADDDEPPVMPPLAGGGAARFKRGRLIHRLLQSLPEAAPADRAALAEAYLSRPAHGLGEVERAEIAAETLAVLEHPDFAPLFGPGSRAEAPLIGAIPGRVISAQVDRLLVEGETVRVIDYKTNRPPPAGPGGVAPLYLGQMAAYRELLRRIYPNKDVCCLLLWTDGPRLMELPDSLLDEHAP